MNRARAYVRPKGRTWGRRGCTPVVTVTGGHNTRVSLAALIAVKPGCRPRLICRVHRRRGGTDKRKGFTETGYADLLDAARDWLTIFQLPPYAHELNPVELVWSHLKRSLANLAKRNISQLTALVKTRLKRMQYRPGLLEGFLASTRLDLTPFCNPHD
jgi:transposase